MIYFLAFDILIVRIACIALIHVAAHPVISYLCCYREIHAADCQQCEQTTSAAHGSALRQHCP